MHKKIPGGEKRCLKNAIGWYDREHNLVGWSEKNVSQRRGHLFWHANTKKNWAMQRSKKGFHAEEQKVKDIKAGMSMECWGNRKNAGCWTVVGSDRQGPHQGGVYKLG